MDTIKPGSTNDNMFLAIRANFCLACGLAATVNPDRCDRVRFEVGGVFLSVENVIRRNLKQGDVI